MYAREHAKITLPNEIKGSYFPAGYFWQILNEMSNKKTSHICKCLLLHLKEQSTGTRTEKELILVCTKLCKKLQ